MKFFAVFFFLLFFAAVGGWFYLDHLHPTNGLSQKQKEQALEKLLGRTPQLTEKSPLSWVLHTGQFFSLMYPKGATIYPSVVGSTILESFRYSFLPDHVLVSSVLKKDEGGRLLEDDSGVRFRLQEQNTYTKLPANAPNCVEFQKQQESIELSLFCVKSAKTLSIVVTAQDDKIAHNYFSFISTHLSW